MNCLPRGGWVQGDRPSGFGQGWEGEPRPAGALVAVRLMRRDPAEQVGDLGRAGPPGRPRSEARHPADEERVSGVGDDLGPRQQLGANEAGGVVRHGEVVADQAEAVALGVKITEVQVGHVLGGEVGGSREGTRAGVGRCDIASESAGEIVAEVIRVRWWEPVRDIGGLPRTTTDARPVGAVGDVDLHPSGVARRWAGRRRGPEELTHGGDTQTKAIAQAAGQHSPHQQPSRAPRLLVTSMRSVQSSGVRFSASRMTRWRTRSAWSQMRARCQAWRRLQPS